MKLDRLLVSKTAKVLLTAPIDEVRIYEDYIAIVFSQAKGDDDTMVVFDHRPDSFKAAKTCYNRGIEEFLSWDERQDRIKEEVRTAANKLAEVEFRSEDEWSYSVSYVILKPTVNLLPQTLFSATEMDYDTETKDHAYESEYLYGEESDDEDESPRLMTLLALTDATHTITLKLDGKESMIGSPPMD